MCGYGTRTGLGRGKGLSSMSMFGRDPKQRAGMFNTAALGMTGMTTAGIGKMVMPGAIGMAARASGWGMAGLAANALISETTGFDPLGEIMKGLGFGDDDKAPAEGFLTQDARFQLQDDFKAAPKKIRDLFYGIPGQTGNPDVYTTAMADQFKSLGGLYDYETVRPHHCLLYTSPSPRD